MRWVASVVLPMTGASLVTQTIWASTIVAAIATFTVVYLQLRKPHVRLLHRLRH